MSEDETPIATAVRKTEDALDGTRYVVLQHDGDDGSWGEIAAVSARSADAAVRDAIAGDATPTGTYVAVPQRSWKPVTVSAVQTTVLKLEEAK